MAYVKTNTAFKVEAQILFDNGEQIGLNEMVKDIRVKESYISNAFPLFVIDLKTTIELRDKLRDNEFKISLKVSSYENLNTDQSKEDEEPVYVDKEIMRCIIRPYSKDYTDTISKTDEESEKNEHSQKDSIQQVPYTIQGIPENLIDKNKQIVNEVISDCGIGDVLVYLFSKYVPGVDLKIDKPTNSTYYDGIVIPPMTLISACNFLHEQYGVYDSGFNMYFGLNGNYIYPQYSKDRIQDNILQVSVKNVDEQTGSTDFYLPAVDENNNIRIYSNKSPLFYSNKKIQDDDAGTIRQFYSYDEYFNKKISGEELDNPYEKARYLFNENGQELFETEYSREADVDDFVMVNFKGVDPTLITPNTQLNVINGFNSANGKYIIFGKQFSISTVDFHHYQSVIQITGAQINK